MSRPRKPWRVTITAPDGSTTDTAYTSEDKTNEYVRTELLAGRGTEARVERWENDCWWHFDTVTAEEFVR